MLGMPSSPARKLKLQRMMVTTSGFTAAALGITQGFINMGPMMMWYVKEGGCDLELFIEAIMFCNKVPSESLATPSYLQ